MDEMEIQNRIRAALSEYGVVFRTNSGDFWQGDLRYSFEFRQRVLINLRHVEGLPKGFPDLLFIGPGCVAFIECKNETGRLSEAQKRFARMLEDYRLKHGTARCVDDALNIIKEENDNGI